MCVLCGSTHALLVVYSTNRDSLINVWFTFPILPHEQPVFHITFSFMYIYELGMVNIQTNIL